MRITKSLLLATLFFMSLGSTYASDTNPNVSKATAEIKKMIEKSDIIKDIESEMTLHVNFMVNEKNEIIVVSTTGNDLDETLKSILNYKKLKTTEFEVNKLYTLPVVLKS